MARPGLVSLGSGSAVTLIGKVALVAPGGMTTVAGTVASLVLLDESLTTAPPGGAPVVVDTVPVAVALPATVAADTVTSWTANGGGGTGYHVNGIWIDPVHQATYKVLKCPSDPSGNFEGSVYGGYWGSTNYLANYNAWTPEPACLSEAAVYDLCS